MTRIRAIQPDELPTFIATATEPQHIDEIRQYVEDLLEKGAMRIDWCYLAERDGHPVGRGAFWTLPTRDHPLSLVLLDLPWQNEAASDVGAALLQKMLHDARSLGADRLEYVLDTPVQQPQWQTHPKERASFVEQHGFSLIRETRRFELETGKACYQSVENHDVIFRAMDEVGETAFKDAVMRVSADTLDQRIRTQREQRGPEEEARENVAYLKSLEYDPTWWELAYTPDEELVGVTIPTKIPACAAIGYIGVVPEMRGQGYVDTLLARGTATLVKTDAERIIADTDVHNTPMTNAFQRAGYTQFARPREYSVLVSE